MNYYTLHNTLDENSLGRIPQVKEVIHNCHVEENSNFIDKFPFKKIKTKPILSNVHLYNESKQTDLIQVSSIGFSYGSMLISQRLKNLFEKFSCFGIEFFSTSLIHKKIVDNYWQTHIYDTALDCIDFGKTDYLLKDRDENRKVIRKFLGQMSKIDFIKFREAIRYPKMLFFNNMTFIDEMNYDYFFIRNLENIGYGVVSESLKDEIEKNQFTGLMFKQINR